MGEGVYVGLCFPKDITKILGVKNLEDETKLLVAIELYREGTVSLGKAAEIADLSIREFLYELRKRDVPFNYDLEELQKDMDVIGEL
ncbi:UPF0175 family protein [Ferroglobus sp.]|uniref:UPF0175 family protein n=1 Tax=Ferroglobus sp. TaxID=2614230 RepID=UPI0025BE9A4F|nr:UPF0175 family protein [Ferroglobus sp.]